MSTMPCILWLSGTAIGHPVVPVVHTLLVEGWAARAGRANPGLPDITTPAQALALLARARTPTGALKLSFPHIYKGQMSANLAHMIAVWGLDSVWTRRSPLGRTDTVRLADGTPPHTLFIGHADQVLVPLAHTPNPDAIAEARDAAIARARILGARAVIGATRHEALALHSPA